MTYYTMSVVVGVLFAFGIGVAESNVSYGSWFPFRGDAITFIKVLGLWLLDSQIFFGWATVPICLALAVLLEGHLRSWLAKYFRSRFRLNLAACLAILGSVLFGVMIGLILGVFGVKLPAV